MQAEEFKAWREQTGYTQAEAAERFFKVTRATVQNWEAGLTPIPAAVETACQVWGRRVRQEAPALGPVTLIYSDGPMYRSPYGAPQRLAMMRQEQYATNAQALARVSEMWGRENFENPFIIEGRETLWNAVELERVVNGGDTMAPTRRNLLDQCASAIKAVAENVRSGLAFIASTGPALLTLPEREVRERRIEALAKELDTLAESTPRGIVTYEHVQERVAALRSLGKTPHSSYVSNVARSFAALTAL